MRGATFWRIVDGKIRDEWSCYNELSAYREVLTQRNGTVFTILLLLMGGVIVAERLLWAAMKVLYRDVRTLFKPGPC